MVRAEEPESERPWINMGAKDVLKVQLKVAMHSKGKRKAGDRVMALPLISV